MKTAQVTMLQPIREQLCHVHAEVFHYVVVVVLTRFQEVPGSELMAAAEDVDILLTLTSDLLTCIDGNRDATFSPHS